MTPFEQRLADTPHREISPELRARILAAAQPGKSLPAFLLSIFSLPHPLAWGAVAATWVVIAALNFSGPRGPELFSVTPKNYKGRLPTPEEYFAQARLRDQLIASLDRDSIEPLLVIHYPPHEKL